MIFGPAFKLDIIPLKQEYSYDEPVEYKVILEVKKDKEIKQLKTRLHAYVVGRTVCWYKERDEEGNESEEPRDRDYYFFLKDHEEILLEKTKPGKGKHEFIVKTPPLIGIPVPGDYGAYRVEWKIESEIPGFLRRTKAEKTVNIKRPSLPGPVEEAKYSGDDLLVIAKIPRYIPLGGFSKIHLQFFSRRGELDCKEIQVELINKLYIRERDIDPSAEQCKEPKHEKTHKSIVVAKDIKLTENTPFNIEIELEIPPNGYPSFKHHDSGSEWILRISYKKGFLRSSKVEIPITVI